MKSNILRKRIESVTRLALVSVLSLVMVFESFALVDAADPTDTVTYSGYTWHRMYCERDLEEFYISGKTNKDQRMYLGQINGGPNDSNTDHWFRALIVYSGDHYYWAGTNKCNDGDSYSGVYIKQTYGIDVSKDSFSTMSGLNCPWIKKSGKDSINDDDCMYYIRCSSGDGLGGSIACMNLNWYGIRHHAAAYSECRWIGAGTPKSWDHRHCYNSSDKYEKTCSCSACVHPEHTFRWYRSFQQSFYDPLKKGELTIQQAHSIYAAYKWNYDSSDGKQYYQGYLSNPVYNKLSIDSPKRIELVKKYCTDTSYYDHSIFGDVSESTEGDEDKNSTTNKDFKLSAYESYCKDYDNGSTNTKVEGTFEIYFDIEGVCDRCYCFPDNDHEIGTSKYETGANRGFKIWIGEPRAVATVSITQALAPGSLIIYKDLIIKSGTRLVVPKNATLVIQGTCYNNGNIYVDGGTLIVEGVLDTEKSSQVIDTRLSGEVARIAGVAEGTVATIVPGSVYLYNNATLIVEEDGILISSRFDKSETILNSGSHATIKGSLTSRNLKLYDSSLRARNGSVILLGFDPGTLNKGETYGKTYFSNNKSEYLVNLGSDCGGGSLVISHSSMQQTGLLYASFGTTVTVANNSTANFNKHWNYNAPISAMMDNW